MNYILPLLSVILGFGVALFLKPKNKTNLKLLLALPRLPNRLLSILVTYLKNDSKKLEGLLYAGLTCQHTKGTAIKARRNKKNQLFCCCC